MNESNEEKTEIVRQDEEQINYKKLINGHQ